MAPEQAIEAIAGSELPLLAESTKVGIRPFPAVQSSRRRMSNRAPTISAALGRSVQPELGAGITMPSKDRVSIPTQEHALKHAHGRRAGDTGHGPVQSNGMCLLEFVVHCNL